MPDPLSCPACGSRVVDRSDRGEIKGEARCQKCGAVFVPVPGDWNPYEAPVSSLKGQVEGAPFGASEIPASVFGKFGLAFRLLGSNLGLFSLIILTVWLPANLAIAFYDANAPEGTVIGVSTRINNLIQAVFGPISAGALIYAIAKRLRGEEVSYGEAMGVGFSNWGRLFVANLIAGILIMLGFLLLVVPGIMLIVRYALIEPAVVLEGAWAPRERSVELTAGRRWSILGAGLLFFTGSGAAGFVLGVVQELVAWLDSTGVVVATDCLIDIGESLITIVMVLFYLEARQQEQARMSDPDDPGTKFLRMSEV